MNAWLIGEYNLVYGDVQAMNSSDLQFIQNGYQGYYHNCLDFVILHRVKLEITRSVQCMILAIQVHYFVVFKKLQHS